MTTTVKLSNGSQGRRHSYTRTRTTSNISLFAEYQLPTNIIMKMTLLGVNESNTVVLIRSEMKLKRDDFLTSLNNVFKKKS